MTNIEIGEAIAVGFVCFLLLDVIFYFVKQYLEDKLKRKKQKLARMEKISDTLEMAIKNSYKGSIENITMRITSVNRTAENDHNIREIERLNKLQDKFKEHIQPTDDVIDKIQRTRTLASKEIRKNKMLALRIICYGFILCEHWELVEGIKLAFADAGLKFTVPQNIDEYNELYEQHFFKELK